jgi:hypothetical protein
MRESIRSAALTTELCTRLPTGDARIYSSQCDSEGLARKCPTDAARIRPTYANMTAPGVEPGLSRPQRDVLTTRRCGPCLRHHQCRPHALASQGARHLRAAFCCGCGKQGPMQSSGGAISVPTSGASLALRIQSLLHRIPVYSFCLPNRICHDHKPSVCGMRHVGMPTQMIRRRALTDGAIALARAQTYARSWPPRRRHRMPARPTSRTST